MFKLADLMEVSGRGNQYDYLHATEEFVSEIAAKYLLSECVR